MSLALIPYEDLEAIALGHVSEETGGQMPPFSFSDFRQKFEAHRSRVGARRKPDYKAWLKDYMGGVSGVRYAGAGSSRVAFILDRQAQGIPGDPPGCCLKVAWNEKGVAQNQAENWVFDKYGDLECFPKVYSSDPDGMWTITEVGARITAKSFDLKQLRVKWNALATVLNAPVWMFMDDTAGQRDVLGEMAYVLRHLDANKTNRTFAEFIGRLSSGRADILQRFPELQTMMSLVDFTLQGGWSDVGIGDLNNNANWAVVYRLSPETFKLAKMPIPIDWGFTTEVMMEFYRR
jgi:hypothetical protein